MAANSMRKITRAQLEPFLAQYQTEATVLDVGAGRVSSNHSYERFFPNRVTVDIDPKREPDHVADIHALPFTDNTYDMVLCTEVIEHCHTPQQAVDELIRITKPGGVIVLTTRFMFPIHDYPHDYWRFTRMQMERLFAGTEILELKAETKSLSAVGAIIQRLVFQVRFKYANRLIKAFLLLLAWIFDHMNGLIAKEYADIRQESSIETVFTTGYYIAARKK